MAGESYARTPRFMAADEQLLRTGLFSDVTVKCGDRTWNLHKNIICSRCDWFKKALTGQFKEASTNVIEINDFEPRLVGWLIEYLYKGVCNIPAMRSPSATTDFITCVELYTVADYFGAIGLCDIALRSLQAEFAAKLGTIQLKFGTEAPWMTEFLEAARLAWADVPIESESYEAAPSSPPTNPASNAPPNTPSTAPSQERQPPYQPQPWMLGPLRTTFITFIHLARFYFLQDPTFNAFLDSNASPALALDIFRAMRYSGDFLTHRDAFIPKNTCSSCMWSPPAPPTVVSPQSRAGRNSFSSSGKDGGSGGGGRKDAFFWPMLEAEPVKMQVYCAACAEKKGERTEAGWVSKQKLDAIREAGLGAAAGAAGMRAVGAGF